MRCSTLAILTTWIGAMLGGTVVAQQAITQPGSIQATAAEYYDSYYSLENAAEPASPSDQPVPPAPAPKPPSANVACPVCGGGGCVECCERDGHGALGDPWTLMGHFDPCCPINAGGWVQFGYTDESNGLFNRHPNRLNNHQSWVFVEKEAVAEAGTWDWGFRFDVLYGVDAQDTQAYGNPPGNWDYLNGFDHGIYGWALPQTYVDVAYGDWNVRLGHFFTTIGNEVVAAPQNFFYSHGLAHYLIEPFTHTGALVSYSVNDEVTLHGGWTLGWDSGFDQLDQGSNFIGGFTVPVVGDATFTYGATAGNFGWRGDNAYEHSMVLKVPITERLKYIGETDLIRVRSTGEDALGIPQYLIWEYNDWLAFGARVEWFKGDQETTLDYFRRVGTGPQVALPPGSHSLYEATFGVNIRPHANFVFRPEIRYDWAPFADYDQTIFGIDMFATF
ncbi:MAG: hypothetical protein A2W31_07075 [Planctomycetes bacterium RBG_16_64_10]|nr:MAG: hypothetical protein A2W31_07075 [Planctomycetes bacterium RBG_16_64_10]